VAEAGQTTAALAVLDQMREVLVGVGERNGKKGRTIWERLGQDDR
jgi:hypothetical protein